MRLWKGCLTPALDGSKAEVPNSREKRKEFRQCGNQHTKGGPVRARVSCIYDMLKALGASLTENCICIMDIHLIPSSANDGALVRLALRRVFFSLMRKGACICRAELSHHRSVESRRTG